MSLALAICNVSPNCNCKTMNFAPIHHKVHSLDIQYISNILFFMQIAERLVAYTRLERG